MAVWKNFLKFLKYIEKTSKSCIKCGPISKKYYENVIFRCTWSKCRSKWSLLKNTPFYNNKLGINTMLLIIKSWSVNVKYKAIAEFLGISIKSVRKIISLTVNSIENSVYVETGIIGGPGIVVEIDEKGVWIFGMVERTPQRKIVFVPVDNRRATTLEELLKKICSPRIYHT
ncbi:DDE-TNP-IS1595 domain-containing protein [Vairimorpha necatrix]|uniref:DDE-TNP-IS1595 domain-containing protein n=1 Tax=Vairimorpha necatrix TaxID=6039 RepID=A0AAX4JBT2_9MICR